MIHIGAVLSSPQDVADTARHAEAVGLDGVWSGDHLLGAGPYLHSTAVLAAAAAATERVTVGWSVMLPALRAPAWAAREISTIAHMASGRCQLGIGIGSPSQEWAVAGTGSAGRAARTDALLGALPELFAGRPANPHVEGTWRPIVMEPAVTAPTLWIGGGADAALRRVLRFDAGWLAALLTPSELRRRIGDLMALTDGRSRRPRVGTMLFVAPSERDGAGDAESVVDTLVRAYGLDPAAAQSLAVSGSPTRLARRFAEYLDAGADTLVVVPFGPDAHTSLGLLAETRSLVLQQGR